MFHVDGAKKLEATPIVHDGLMYVSNTNEMYALDARNGRKVWHYRAAGPRGRVSTGARRSLAIRFISQLPIAISSLSTVYGQSVIRCGVCVV